MMALRGALTPWQYNCTLSNQFYAFEFPASAFFQVNRQRGTFGEFLKQFLTVRVEEDTFQEI